MFKSIETLEKKKKTLTKTANGFTRVLTNKMYLPLFNKIILFAMSNQNLQADNK